MHTVIHRALEELLGAWDEIRRSPAHNGTLAMIVRRPAIDHREVLNQGWLDLAEGLVGDHWKLTKEPHARHCRLSYRVPEVQGPC